MARPTSDYPTELELQILKILWDHSPLLVREVREALAEDGRDIAHTSVITTLNTMVTKKTLSKKKQGNSYLFSPKVTREQVCDGMLGDVYQRVFDRSPTAMMLSLFNCSDLDEDELKELRKIINKQLKRDSQ